MKTSYKLTLQIEHAPGIGGLYEVTGELFGGPFQGLITLLKAIDHDINIRCYPKGEDNGTLHTGDPDTARREVHDVETRGPNTNLFKMSDTELNSNGEEAEK